MSLVLRRCRAARLFCLALITSGIAFASPVAAIELSLGSDITVPGGSASIALELEPGSGVAHLQVDILFDPAILTPGSVTAGDGLTDHVLDWAVVAPGTLRLVIYSPSCAPLGIGAPRGLADPAQIALLAFTVAPDAPPGIEDVILASPVLAAGDGGAVPADLIDGTIEIQFAPPVPEIPTLSPLGGVGLALLLVGLALVLLRRRSSRPGAALSIALALLGLAAAGRVAAAIAPHEVVDAILGRSASDPSLDCNSDSVVDVRDIACVLEPGCLAQTPSPTPSPSPTLSPTATATPTATQAPPTPTPSTTPGIDNNQAPVLAAPGDRETRGRQLFALQLQATDPDLVRGDVLRFSLVVRPTGLTVDRETGALLWSPTENQSGVHAVTARVVDLGGLSDQKSFLIAVNAVGDPPVIAPIADQSTVEDVLLALTASAIDPDLPDDVLTFSLPLAPTGMAINPATGAIAWTPSAAQVGLHDVTVEVSDQQGQLDFTSFVVTVGSTNEAPVANDDAYVVRTGETLVVAAPGVLENDSDPNGDALSTVLVDPPAQGDLELHADGSFEYTPTLVGGIDESIDLTRLTLPKAVASSSRTPALGPHLVIDGDLATSWYTSTTDTNASLALNFVRPVAVRQILYSGDRLLVAQARDFTSGVFELFDGGGALLFSSGEVTLPLPSRDAVIDVEGAAGGPVLDVRRVLFRATGYEGTNYHGFAELQVIGDGIVEVLDAELEWSWNAASTGLTNNSVLAAPTVGDLDGDGLPEVAFPEGAGRLYVVNGEDGSAAWSANDMQRFSSSPVLGDIDDDGRMEVIVVRSSSSRFIAVFEDDGTFKTQVDTGLGIGEANLALADLEGDGVAEIIVPGSSRVAAYHLEAGALVELWESEALGCGNNAYRTNCIPLVSDVDLDGSPDIVAGRVIYDANGGTKHHAPALPDGWNAIGNFDDDPFAEIVLVSVGLVRLLEHDLTVKWGPVDPPGAGNLGPPTVADFDGDGQAEIGIAGSNRYFVLEADGSVLWEAVIVDGSSNRTGSTVFDFQNDGSAEVVYRDENNLWVFRGSDGAVLFQSAMGSTTTVEYPIVADIDADGEVEIVAVSDSAQALAGGGIRPPGLYVFGSVDGDWVRGRPIWNQHTYHVTNVLPDGTIPAIEQPNWLVPGLNNFRKNDFLPDEASRADTFSYKANDGTFDSNVATVFLDLRPPNTAPEIVSEPDRTATSGIQYLYAPRAVDLDFDPLVFALGEGPAGMTIDPATGLLRWTPGPGDLGDHLVSVSVTDDDGFSGFQAFTLTVAEPVEVPDVVGLDLAAADAALVGASLATGNVSQTNHPTIAAGLVIAQTPPAGSIAEPGSMVALVESLGPAPEDIDDDGDTFTENQGDPNDDDPTIYPGAPEIPGDGIDQDGDGVDGTVPPVAIEVVPGTLDLLQGETAALQAFGIFADDSAQNITALVTWSSTSGSVASVSAAGVMSALTPGSTQIEATRDGVTGTANVSVAAADNADEQAPAALITSPAEGAVVQAPVDIVGTASDPNLVRYELAISPAGENSFTTIGGGTSPVVAGILGQLDPTLLINDLYRLRLRVLDAGGNVTAFEVTFQADGLQKVGNLTLSFLDLSVPLSGLPIEVQRTYDSRDKRKGEFGVGWRLAVRSLEISCTSPLGLGWRVIKSGLAFGLAQTRAHRCSLTFPDGRVEEFDFVPSPTISAIVPFSFLSGSFKARPGTRGKLQSLDNTFLAIFDPQPGEVELLDDTTFLPFNPKRFLYTAGDGTRITVGLTSGVERLQDPNGNALVFGPGGIVHSSGKSVGFVRDPQGRITSIIDPKGKVQTYEYDGEGNLVRHTDRGGNITRFRYNQDHGLLKVEDPLGRPLARNEYDDEGRLIASTAANGRTVTFSHDVDNRTEVITDADGAVTTLEFDARGNVTRMLDAIGGETLNTYDADDNQLTTTNPLGETITRTFDSRGNELTETNDLGQTITFTYDAGDRVTSLKDPLGRTRTLTYDSRGNLLETIDAAGGATTNSYDARGNLLAQSDPMGAITSYQYDAFGATTARIDPLGHRLELTYDANGSLLTETDEVDTTVITMVDDRGLFTGKTSPLGQSSSFAWGVTGLLEAATDPAGHTTSRTVDATGRDVSRTDAAGRVTALEHDLGGNLQKVTAPGGIETTFEYDLLDRRKAEIDALGGRRETTYDGAGRVISVKDPRGNVTQFEYDTAGRNTKTIDALGKATLFAHDANGNQAQLTDALGRVHTFVYDELNRLVETHFPGGASTETVYDAAGRVIEEIDELGRSTHFEYDAAGQLIAVIDSLGGETSYGYDAAGHLVLQTDANGNTTTFQYDVNGRRSKVIYPDGGTTVESYDLAGNVATHTEPNGATTGFEYDPTGRLTAKILAADRVDFTYTPSGKLATATDNRGTTTFSYDGLDRVVLIVNFDDSSIAYTYDAAGNVTSSTTKVSAVSAARTVSYSHDALDRLATVTDEAGLVTAYTYDDVGNRKSVVYDNGASTEFSYDNRNRLIQIDHRQGAALLEQFVYTLDAVGDRKEVTELDGTIVTFEYDALRRLTRETSVDSSATTFLDVSYTYDDVGNRLTRTDHSGAAVITYDYDESDRLTSAGATTFDYDANGNLASTTVGGVTTTFEWDQENRLHRVVDPVAGETTFLYDFAGNRVQRTDGDGVVRFLVDTLNRTGFSQVLEEYSGSTRFVSYVYGDDLINQVRSGQRSWYHYDATATTRLLTDGAGAASDSYRFAAFGELLETSGSTLNHYLFSGERLDPNVGFYHLRARYYAPSFGRFVSRDPLAGNLTDPPSLHRYLYAHANPVAFMDPSGELTLGETIAVNFTVNVVLSLAFDAFIMGERDPNKLVFGALISGAFGAVSGGIGAKLAPTALQIGAHASLGNAGVKMTSGIVNYLVRYSLLRFGVPAIMAGVDVFLYMSEEAAKAKFGGVPSGAKLVHVYAVNFIVRCFGISATIGKVNAQTLGNLANAGAVPAAYARTFKNFDLLDLITKGQNLPGGMEVTDDFIIRFIDNLAKEFGYSAIRRSSYSLGQAVLDFGSALIEAIQGKLGEWSAPK